MADTYLARVTYTCECRPAHPSAGDPTRTIGPSHTHYVDVHRPGAHTSGPVTGGMTPERHVRRVTSTRDATVALLDHQGLHADLITGGTIDRQVFTYRITEAPVPD